MQPGKPTTVSNLFTMCIIMANFESMFLLIQKIEC